MQSETPEAPTVWFSASQVGQYRDCARKWAWRYVAGIKSPPTKSQELGTEVDDQQIQPYLRNGRPFDFTRPSGAIANELRHYLPAPQTPGMVVQKEIRIVTADTAFGFLGYIDVFVPGHVRTGEYAGVPLVIDTKTTANLRYAKSPRDLATDPQAVLYATATMLESGAAEVDLEWLYTQTRGAHATRRVHLRMHADAASTQYEAIEATGRELFGIKASGVQPLDLPPNVHACDMFGGCPYQHKCNLEVGLFRKPRGVNMGDAKAGLAALKARVAAGGTAAGAPVAAPEPTAVPAAPPAEAAALPAWATAPVDPLAAAKAAGKPYAGINPPEAALPPAPVAEVAKPKRGRPAKAAVQAEPAPAAFVSDSGSLISADDVEAAVTRALRRFFAGLGGES